MVSVLHCRSDVDVGAADCHWLLVQLLVAVHARSSVSDGAFTCHSLSAHIVNGEHQLSDTAVAVTLW